MQNTLQALKELGGSGSVQEINEKVYAIANISDEVKIKTRASGTNELYNNLGWARNELKVAQLIESPQRGIWSLKSGINPALFNIDVNDFVKIENYLCTETDTWKAKVLEQINSFPHNGKGFEKLSKVLLEQYGFSTVEVVGGKNDKGIDGIGMYKVDNTFFDINIPVVFQCKQWASSIRPTDIRDFRGAMDGKTTFGIFITTGDFSKNAKKEATRPSTSGIIRLINRDLLCEMMKEKSMGIKGVFRVHNELEVILINEKWFEQFKK
jgi:restriction system protein